MAARATLRPVRSATSVMDALEEVDSSAASPCLAARGDCTATDDAPPLLTMLPFDFKMLKLPFAMRAPVLLLEAPLTKEHRLR